MNREMENHCFSLDRNDSVHAAFFSFLIDCALQSLNPDEWIQCISCCSFGFGIIETARDCLLDEWHTQPHESIGSWVLIGPLHHGQVNHMLFRIREQGYQAAIQIGLTLAHVKKGGSEITAAFELNSFYDLS